MPFCRHDAWMQHWRVTHQYCIHASSRHYGVDTLLKGRYNALMQCRQVNRRHCLVHHDNKWAWTLRHHPVVKGLNKIHLPPVYVGVDSLRVESVAPASLWAVTRSTYHVAGCNGTRYTFCKVKQGKVTIRARSQSGQGQRCEGKAGQSQSGQGHNQGKVKQVMVKLFL